MNINLSKSILGFLSIIALVLALPSCAVFNGQPLTTSNAKRVTVLVSAGTQLGATQLLIKHPEYREGLMVSSDALQAICKGKEFQPVYVDLVLRKKLNDELKDPAVAAVYQTVLDVVIVQYQVFWEENIAKWEAGNMQYAVLFLDAARAGIDAALSSKAQIPTTDSNPLKQAEASDLKL